MKIEKFEDIEASRGMPQWRAAQRAMPIATKIELIGRFIRETRKLESIKKTCMKSVTSWSNSSAKAP
jgi:hypothetical protein